MKIFIDNGHGLMTAGKRSPDGTLLEYAYTHTLSDTLATCLYQSARRTLKGKAIRTDYARDGDPDGEENFYILRHTHCPAVLIEYFLWTTNRISPTSSHKKADEK